MISRVAVTITASLLGACASQLTPAPPNPTVACLADLMNAPEVRPIAGKIQFGSRANVQMVSDPSRATPEQQLAIQAAEARYSACIDLGTAWRRQYVPPEMDAIGIRFARETQAALALLFRGEISFGQYNTHTNALRADLEQRQGEMRAARLQQQDEQRRREQIARILAPPLPPAPQLTFTPLPPRPRTTTTTCQAVGTQVVCTTD